MIEIVVRLFAFFVASLFVMLHHGSRRDFPGAFAIASRALGGLLDVLVHPFFFLSDTFGAFSSSRHDNLLLCASADAPVIWKLRFQ
jgi:hypothetical protein